MVLTCGADVWYVRTRSPGTRARARSFASVFASSDPAAFREVFETNLPELVEQITDNNLLLTIAQHVEAANLPNLCFVVG